MGLRWVLMVNKQGQTRLASYYEWLSIEERTALEAEVIRRCLSRTEHQCSFMEYRGMKVVYRRYASLFFIVGVDQDDEVRPWAAGAAGDSILRRDPLTWAPPRPQYRAAYRGVVHSRFPGWPAQNELGILEFIHALVETLDKYFENVCELDIMFNLEKAHFILGAAAARMETRRRCWRAWQPARAHGQDFCRSGHAQL
jgi:AP-4 complex subunit sigma-1